MKNHAQPAPAEPSNGHGLVRASAAVTAVYALLTVLFTFPAVTKLKTHVIGGWIDGPMFLWNTWWAPRALFRLGQNPLFTTQLFYPEGASLVVNTHHVLPSLLSAPLQWMFGLVAGYNLMVLATFPLAGLAAFLLINEIVGDRRAAFIGGLIFAFGHIRMSFIVFPNLIQSQFVVFFAWALIRAYRKRSLSAAAVAAVFAAATAYSSYNLFVFCFVFASAFCVAVVAAERGRVPLRVLLGWALLAVLTLALFAPLGTAIRAEMGQHGDFITNFKSRSYNEAVPVVRYISRVPMNEPPTYPLRHASYLGWAALLLCAVGIARERRNGWVWFWCGLAVVSLVLSVGPRFNLSQPPLAGATDATAFKLPFAYLQKVPVLKQIRASHRFALFVSLAMAVLASYGVAALMQRWSGAKRWGRALPFIIAGIVAYDFLHLPFAQMYRLPRLDEVQAVIDDPRDCAVVEFPGGRLGYTPFGYMETQHGKPVYANGQIARMPDALRNRPADSPLLSTLQRIYDNRNIRARNVKADHDAIRQEVIDNRIGWIVLAWPDKATLRRDKSLPTLNQMQLIDKVLQEALPIENATTYPADVLDMHRKDDTWRSEPLIYGIYKVDLGG